MPPAPPPPRRYEPLPRRNPKAAEGSEAEGTVVMVGENYREVSDLVEMKISLLGDRRIGKTSFLAKYAGNEKQQGQYVKNGGLNYVDKIQQVQGARLFFSIWEVGGDDHSQNHIPTVCKDSVAILFMFDLTSRCTLNRQKEPPDEEEEEESGWTQYLEDFSPVHTSEPKQGGLSGVAVKKEGDDINSVTAMDASLMSDAGSGPEWKKNRIVMYGNKFVLKKVNCANTGMMSGREVIPLDGSLEDTASSPVNSPHIALSFKRMDIMNPRKLCPDECTEGYPEKTGDSESGAVLKGSGGGKIDHGCSGADHLKKKGLCLVPLSAFINYVG